MSNLQKNIYWFVFWTIFAFFSIDTMLLFFVNQPKNIWFFIAYRGAYYACLVLLAYLTKGYTND